MKRLARRLGLSTALFMVPFAGAQGDVPEAVICSIAEILECHPVDACERVSGASIGAPNFLRVDFAEGVISRTQPGGEDKVSPIERAEELDGRLVLQGAEGGIEGAGGGLGWSMSIDTHSGDMVLTGSGDGVGFVIFGACVAP